MKKLPILLLPVLALFLASSRAGRADEFTDVANNPNGFWVSSPTPQPPVAYYEPGPSYYDYGPYPYGSYPYYGGPIFSFGFGFGGHGHGGGWHHH